MTTTSKAPKQLSDKNSQGTVLGASTSDLIGFYGINPGVGQPGSVTQTGSTFISLSMSSGALSSAIAIALNSLGLINCSSVSP
jgi:hypothetical protein